jgi:pimeloyl-ACP methyl ester carboxylesterase
MGTAAPARLSRVLLLAGLALVCLLAGPTGVSARAGVAEARSATPHLLLIHGGSFLFEDQTFEPLTRVAALRAGFIPHYLRYPLGDMPAAFRAARAEALRLRARYGNSVYAYGTSAGGTLAALLAGDGLVSAAVAKAPPTDLLGWRWPLGAYGVDYYEQIGLTPTARRRLSPLRRPARRPLLLVHGRRDRVVSAAMSAAFAAKFEQVRLWVVRGGHHTERSWPVLLTRSLEWLASAAATLR